MTRICSPPLLQEDAVERQQVAYGDTEEDLEPHLSLMNFSYYQTDEVIIMYESQDDEVPADTERAQCGILIHDFPHLNVDKDISLAGRSFSITLKGKAAVMDGWGERRNIAKSHGKEPRLCPIQ